MAIVAVNPVVVIVPMSLHPVPSISAIIIPRSVIIVTAVADIYVDASVGAGDRKYCAYQEDKRKQELLIGSHCMCTSKRTLRMDGSSLVISVKITQLEAFLEAHADRSAHPVIWDELQRGVVDQNWEIHS